MINKRIVVFSIIALIFAGNIISAQVTQKEAETTIEKFFSLCKKGDFHNAAGLLIYSGQDKARLYNDFFNPENPDEFKEVKRICKRVNATLLISDSYNFGKLRNVKFFDKTVQSFDVFFKSGKQKMRKRILLTKVKNKTGILSFN